MERLSDDGMGNISSSTEEGGHGWDLGQDEGNWMTLSQNCIEQPGSRQTQRDGSQEAGTPYDGMPWALALEMPWRP